MCGNGWYVNVRAFTIIKRCYHIVWAKKVGKKKEKVKSEVITIGCLLFLGLSKLLSALRREILIIILRRAKKL